MLHFLHLGLETAMFSYVLISALFLIGLTPMILEMVTKRFDFFNLKNPFIIYFLIQIGVSGLFTLVTGNVSEIGLDPVAYADAYENALLLCVLGLLTFQVGYYSQKNRTIRLPHRISLNWVGSRFAWLSVIFIFCGWVAFWLLLQINGGVANFLETRESWRAGGLAGQGFLIFPATNLLALAALIYVIGKSHDLGRDKMLRIKIIVMVVLALTPAYFLGFRSALLLPIVQLLVVWNFRYELKRGFLLLMLAIVACAFTGYGVLRSLPADQEFDTVVVTETVMGNPDLLYGLFLRSRGTEVVASVMNTLDKTGEFDYGWKSVVEAATIIVPGKIWAGKPQPSGERFTTYFFRDDFRRSRGVDQETWGGISPTIVGELYWHFGWFGVLCGLYLLGRIAKITYVTLLRNVRNPSMLAIYAVFYASFAMFSEAMQGYINALVMFTIIILPTVYFLTAKFPLSTSFDYRDAK